MFEVSEPLPFAESPWGFLGANRNVRRYSGNARRLVAILEEEHDPDAIDRAGVAVQNADGSLTPAPVIGEGQLELLFLREKKNLPPVDVVTNFGSLANSSPPCFHANTDFFSSACMAKKGQVFIARSVVEVAVLRLLGFAATVIAGLESLTGSELRQLLAKPECVSDPASRQRARLAPIRHRRDVSLVFIAFDFLNLQAVVPDTVQCVLARFSQLSSAFEFDFGILQVWQPAEADLNAILLAATLSDAGLAKTAISNSLKRSLKDFKSYQRDCAQPVDFNSAELALTEEVRRSRDRNYPTPELAAARETFDRLFDETVIQPLREEAIATRDPIERPLLHLAIELTQELHRTAPLRRLADVAGTRADQRAPEPLTRDEREQRHQASTQLAEIYRKLRAKR